MRWARGKQIVFMTKLLQLAWGLAFVSCVMAQISHNIDQRQDPTNNHRFSPYVWWSVAYNLVLLGGVFTTIISDSVNQYRVAAAGYLACDIVLTTSAVDSLIYSTKAADQAAAVGFILLSGVIVGIKFTRERKCLILPGRVDLLLWIDPVACRSSTMTCDY